MSDSDTYSANDTEAPRIRRVSTAAPSSPLPPVPTEQEPAPVTALAEAPPLPRRRGTSAASKNSQAPPLPARRGSSAVEDNRDKRDPPSASRQHQAPPLPLRRNTVQPEHISTPPPLGLYEPGPEGTSEGTYAADTDKAPTVTQPTSDSNAYHIPTAAHRGGFHRTVNSLPVNVLPISAPPDSDALLVMPSAPPLTDRIPTFMSVGHHVGASDVSSSSSDSLEASRRATPAPNIQIAALSDARANMKQAKLSDRVLNFRDLGVSVMRAGCAMHQSRTRASQTGPMPGVVYRSAEVGSAGEHDVKTLLSRYGIRTIIDLRSELEARASDILSTHYPASIQPSSDDSDKLTQLRTAQLRNTVVEVAAHDYEAAARPWERTGESRSSWSRRNSLRYSKSVGDPSKDPLARALSHLYDYKSDSETESISADAPYVPRVPEPEAKVEAELLFESGAHAPQHPGMVQTAYDWGNETLSMLRSYWDYQWNGERKSEPPAAPLPPLPQTDSQQATQTLPDPDHRSDAAGRRGSSGSSTDSFYHNSPGDASREPTQYGLRPVNRTMRDGAMPPQIVVGSVDTQQTDSSQMLADDAETLDEAARLPRSTTEPSLVNMMPAPPSEHDTSKRQLVNRFGGTRARFRCNVIGENYRKKCVWAHAPLSTKIKVVLRFATFNKAEAIRTIGREVLGPRGLAGSYEDYIDYCKEEFAAVMRIFADPCAYPILFHCQHGKDRTGIIAMLLLGILGVDDRIIAEDYSLSEKCLVPVRRRMELIDMGAVGLPPSFCDSPAPVMLNLLRHIRTNYGSVHGYLRSAGLSEREISTIAWCLRGNFCDIARAAPRRSRMYLQPSSARSEVLS
ncbi:hypothetical protein IWW42_001719 [Coemansia sp. RSA 1085]|nr:hypothetical protein IWW42_001719 [Coemansia sp. RSA 1085]